MSGGYLRGTRILTQKGEVAVEDLQIGDVVVSRFGSLRPIGWIGRQSFAGQSLGKAQAPVCFRVGSIAEDVPARDLYVSPAHRMIFADHLVGAALLVNGVTITQTATDGPVEYYHLDLGAHDCIIAESAWSESYAEQGKRAAFHNHKDFLTAFPGHNDAVVPMCLPPVTVGSEELLGLRKKLIARVPEDSVTGDADLHIMADDTRIDGERIDNRRWAFTIPAGARSLYLMSHATKPGVFGDSKDERALGFCLASVSSEMAGQTITLKMDHPGFEEGVFRVEGNTELSWRWTDGACRLPGILIVGNRTTTRIVVTGHAQKRYLALPGAKPATPQPSLTADPAPGSPPLLRVVS